jgi:hypothetical protein
MPNRVNHLIVPCSCQSIVPGWRPKHDTRRVVPVLALYESCPCRGETLRAVPCLVPVHLARPTWPSITVPLCVFDCSCWLCDQRILNWEFEIIDESFAGLQFVYDWTVRKITQFRHYAICRNKDAYLHRWTVFKTWCFIVQPIYVLTWFWCVMVNFCIELCL